ncbi:MAG: choice-of-anchor D domain-containing protein [Proteobacteria bacterium]|nr:choice-of-anchor D domain-containing protein [Pseudomonadota bacterium]
MRTALLSIVALSAGCIEYDVGSGTDNNSGTDTDTGEIIVDPGAPDILVEPMNLGFGTRPTDCAADDQIVTVTNIGEDELLVDSIELLGAGAGSFDLVGGPSNLLQGESFTFTVGFTPNAQTDFNARVQIKSNDPDEGEVDVSLLGSGGENTINSDVFDQGLPEKVDVLWVLDNSCSMSDKVQAVESGMDSFIGSFVDLGLDFQMGVVTTDMDDPLQSGLLQGPTKVMASATMTDAQIITAFDAAFDPTSAGSGSEKPMAAAQASINGTGAGYASTEGLIRTNAHLSIIVITDEEDSSGQNAAHWTSWVDGLKPAVNMTNVSGLIDQGGNSFDPNCASAPIGFDMLKDIIDNTGGLRDGICQLVDANGNANPATVDQLLEWLSFTAAGLQTTFELSGEPTNLSQIRVTVDGTQVDYSTLNGWYYDSATNSVIFYGDAIPGSATQVVVTYPVESDCL